MFQEWLKIESGYYRMVDKSLDGRVVKTRRAWRWWVGRGGDILVEDDAPSAREAKRRVENVMHEMLYENDI